jgi:hypothetical protein
MPSALHRRWTGTRARAFDGIERALAALSGSGGGSRGAGRQVGLAYAVLLASQFQGFSRDLHTECVDHLMGALAPAPPLALTGAPPW